MKIWLGIVQLKYIHYLLDFPFKDIERPAKANFVLSKFCAMFSKSAESNSAQCFTFLFWEKVVLLQIVVYKQLPHVGSNSWPSDEEFSVITF